MALPIEKCVAIALWQLATGDSYRSTGKTFGVAKSTTVSITHYFCEEPSSHAVDFIKFLLSRKESAAAISKFREYCNCKIPQIVGAIDGTHIGIKALQNESKIDYFCHRQKYSVNAQAVVGANLIILDLATGYSESLHDSRVLRNSNIFGMADNGDVLSCPDDIIENARISLLILGDGMVDTL